MSTIFITGGAGEVGAAIIRALHQKHSIIALFHNKKGEQLSNVEWVEGDLLHSHTYIPYLKKSDVLIHAAAVTDHRSPDLFHVNVSAAQEIALHAWNYGCKKIIVFGSASTTQHFLTPYAQSKLEMEKALAELHIPMVVLRPTLEYQKGSRILKGLARYTELTVGGVPLPFVPLMNGGKADLRPIHASDLVRAVEAVLENPFPERMEMYDLASAQSFTYKQAMETIMAAHGIEKPFLSVPHWGFQALHRTLQSLGVRSFPRFAGLGALGESYHVDAGKFTRVYGVQFTNPYEKFRECV